MKQNVRATPVKQRVRAECPELRTARAEIERLRGELATALELLARAHTNFEEVAAPDLRRSEERRERPDLSVRELEVAQLIGLGRTVKEIAGGLALSEKTVSTYRSRILMKLHLQNTAELIRYVLQNHLSE